MQGSTHRELLKIKNLRSHLKQEVIELQEWTMLERMMEGSKTNKVLVKGFHFNGKMKSYLGTLPFSDARSLFMLRYRMLPTKANYRGRWKGSECNICGREDNDKHLFDCPGFGDLLINGITHDLFFDEYFINNGNGLSAAAKIITQIKERLEVIQESDEKYE